MNVAKEYHAVVGKFYLGETMQWLETRIREHKDACVNGSTDKSAISEQCMDLPTSYAVESG